MSSVNLKSSIAVGSLEKQALLEHSVPKYGTGLKALASVLVLTIFRVGVFIQRIKRREGTV